MSERPGMMLLEEPDANLGLASRVAILCIANFALGFGIGYVYGKFYSAKETWTKTKKIDQPSSPALPNSSATTTVTPTVTAPSSVSVNATNRESVPENPIKSDIISEVSKIEQDDMISESHGKVSEEIITPSVTEATVEEEEVIVDEFPMGKSGPKVCVSQLYIYPIKCCAPQSVTCAKITPYGLENDQLFMIVDFTGRSVSVDRCPSLSGLKATIQEDGDLKLESVEDDTFILKPKAWGEKRLVTSEGKSYEAVDQGDEIGEFLAKALEMPGARLVRVRDEYMSAQTGRRRSNAEPEQGFKNKSSCVLSSESSFETLRKRLGESIPISKFNTNILVGVVDILEPFAENGWEHINTKNYTFCVDDICKIDAKDVTNAMDDSDKRKWESFLQRVGDEYEIPYGRNVSIDGASTEEAVIQVGDMLSVSKTSI